MSLRSAGEIEYVFFEIYLLSKVKSKIPSTRDDRSNGRCMVGVW